MDKRNLQNNELDRIGRKLFEAAKIRDEEIEQIVGSEMLFDSIKTRIKIEQRSQNQKNVSLGQSKWQIWNWQRASAMVLLLFIIGVIGFSLFRKITPQQQFEKAAAPAVQPIVKQIETEPLQMTPQNLQDSSAIVKITDSKNESPKITKQKVSINKILKTQKSALRKTKQQHRLQPRQNESAGEFYALAFTGNPVETGERLQIIRAELSRSSLFALGVNLPIENESEKIKTDLLVGADGVAKAIRLVE
jgi:hypothetical protein